VSLGLSIPAEVIDGLIALRGAPVAVTPDAPQAPPEAPEAPEAPEPPVTAP
jgi:hypothetical protein